ADLLPVEIVENAQPSVPPAGDFQPAWQVRARQHPWLRPVMPELLRQPEPFHWAADGLRARAEAEVLAVHPQRIDRSGTARGVGRRQPLVVEWTPGAGRCLFLGFDESWRWRVEAGADTFATYWRHTLRYAARTRPRQVTLRPLGAGPVRQGDTLRVEA